MSGSMGSNSGAGAFRRGERTSASSLERLREHSDKVLQRRHYKYNLKIHPAGTMAIPKASNAPQRAAICSPLYVDLAEVEGTWKATVRAGYVNNIVPEIASNPLTDVPAPELTVSAAGDVYAKVTWEPGSAYNGTDYIPSGGTITDVDCLFASTAPTDVEPEVNTTTGVATVDGVFHFMIATITYDSETELYSVAVRRAGHRFATICGKECRVSWNGC